MKKIIKSLAVIVAVAAIGAGATFAVFSDTEVSEGNTLSAGTLDLKVDGEDYPNIETMTFADVKPGDSFSKTWKVRNTGSLDGKVKIKIDNIVSNDEGCNDPEKEAEELEYGSASCGDNEGELARFLRTQVFQSHVNVESPIGDGISDYHANALTGRNPSGSPYGGMLYIEGNEMEGQTLGQNDFQMVKLDISLDEDVINDGAGWWTGHDVDDNILQSDSVTFDVIFSIEQE